MCNLEWGRSYYEVIYPDDWLMNFVGAPLAAKTKMSQQQMLKDFKTFFSEQWCLHHCLMDHFIRLLNCRGRRRGVVGQSGDPSKVKARSHLSELWRLQLSSLWTLRTMDQDFLRNLLHTILQTLKPHSRPKEPAIRDSAQYGVPGCFS